MAKPSENHSSSIEFFKVFLSSVSSRQLSFPPALVMQLNGTAPENATLKDHNGRIWDVQLVKTERKLIIEEGWKAFASHHFLVDGDFLVFKFDMNSQFFVKIYSRNGLEKRNVLSIKDSVKEEADTESEVENARNKSTGGCKRKYSEMESKQTQRSAGRSKGTNSKLGRTKGSSGERTSSLRQIRATNSGISKNIKASSYIKPQKPSFEMIMTRSTRYTVYVHRLVVKTHNLKLQENMKLRGESGKFWPVKVCFRTDGRIIINNGWAAFHRKHKVAIGDTCVFEFIPAENNMVKEIQVQILRKPVNHTKKEALRA